jgi:hypothetical protein
MLAIVDTAMVGKDPLAVSPLSMTASAQFRKQPSHTNWLTDQLEFALIAVSLLRMAAFAQTRTNQARVPEDLQTQTLHFCCVVAALQSFNRRKFYEQMVGLADGVCLARLGTEPDVAVHPAGALAATPLWVAICGAAHCHLPFLSLSANHTSSQGLSRTSGPVGEDSHDGCMQWLLLLLLPAHLCCRTKQPGIALLKKIL